MLDCAISQNQFNASHSRDSSHHILHAFRWYIYVSMAEMSSRFSIYITIIIVVICVRIMMNRYTFSYMKSIFSAYIGNYTELHVCLGELYVKMSWIQWKYKIGHNLSHDYLLENWSTMHGCSLESFLNGLSFFPIPTSRYSTVHLTPICNQQLNIWMSGIYECPFSIFSAPSERSWLIFIPPRSRK